MPVTVKIPPTKQFTIRTKRSQKLEVEPVTLQVHGKLFCVASLDGLASKELDEFSENLREARRHPLYCHPVDIKLLEIIEEPEKPEARTRFERINEDDP